MFNYGLKFRIILVLFFIILFFISFSLVKQHNAKAGDLIILNQVQKIAEGLEGYYSKFNAYPNSPRVDVSSIGIISDQGINKKGEYIYFRDKFIWDRVVYLQSEEQAYTLEFTLTEKWNLWGIDSREGAVCNINSGIRMICENKPATFLDYFR